MINQEIEGTEPAVSMEPISSRSIDNTSSGSYLGQLLILARPLHWIKNGFVFIPFLFAAKLTDFSVLYQGILVFWAFCLASSSVYIFNDIMDVKSDRLHPKKRTRPIASGRISVSVAVVYLIFVASGTVVLSLLHSPVILAIILTYVVINIFYSLYIKHIVLLDVFSIAAGFLLRVFAGAYASTQPPSHWLLLMTLFIALFLGFGKRRSELATLENNGEDHRRVLTFYSLRTIDQLLTVLIGLVVVTFSLYTVSDYTMQRFGTDALVYTVPLVVYGLFRYLFLVNERKYGGDPTEVLLSDAPLIFTVLGWLAASFFIIYF